MKHCLPEGQLIMMLDQVIMFEIWDYLMAQVLLADFLRSDDLRVDHFVSTVLQLFLLADSTQSRAAAAVLIAKLAPSAKHLSVLEVTSNMLPVKAL